MLNKFLYFCVFFSISIFANVHEIPTVSYVDLERYQGRWYEIARFPHSFQKDCGQSVAEYKPLPKGLIRVLNSCPSLKNPEKIHQAQGLAKVVDESTQAKLKVTFTPWFGWAFAGDYWILDLDEEYEHALVGTPDLNYLWILARNPVITNQELERLVSKAHSLGFDTHKLIYSGQTR